MFWSVILYIVIICCTAQQSFPLSSEDSISESSPKNEIIQGKSYPVLAFDLGVDSQEDVLQKILKISEDCSQTSGLTKEVHLFNCSGDLPIQQLEPRIIRGKWTSLLLVTGENSPLHYVSMDRKYSIPNAVVEDYQSTLQYLIEQLGEPQRKEALKEEILKKPLVRVVSIWEKEDLKVELSVMKMGNSSISIYEKWTHISLSSSIKEKIGQSGHMSNPAKQFDGEIQEIDRAKGITPIVEIFANRISLSGQEVSVTGTVVKSNTVFGTNWYHLQDGTGEDGNNDLTITSDDQISVGSVVTFTGELTIDKDLGFGYFYPAIIENAKRVE